MWRKILLPIDLFSMMIAFLPSSKLDHGLVKLKSPEGEINKIHFMAAVQVHSTQLDLTERRVLYWKQEFVDMSMSYIINFHGCLLLFSYGFILYPKKLK